MLDFVLKASMIHGDVYRKINDSIQTLLLAFVVVGFATLSFGFGFKDTLLDISGGPGLMAVVMSSSTTIVGWVIWSYVTFIIGSKMLGGTASIRLLLRGIGIAHMPGILVGFVAFFEDPVARDTVLMISLVWMLMAGIVAVHEIQKEGWVRAIIPATMGWLFGVVFFRAFILQPQPI